MKEFIMAICVFFTFSCQSQKVHTTIEDQNTTAVNEFPEALLGKWTLEYMSPVQGKSVEQLYQIQMPYLNFVDDHKVAGNNGCNNIAGTYTIDGKKIHFDTSEFRSTKMFCQNVDEAALLNALRPINRYSFVDDGNRLMLLTGDIAAMIFVRSVE